MDPTNQTEVPIGSNTSTGIIVPEPSSGIKGTHDDHPQTDPTEGRQNPDDAVEPETLGPERLGSSERIP